MKCPSSNTTAPLQHFSHYLFLASIRWPSKSFGEYPPHTFLTLPLVSLKIIYLFAGPFTFFDQSESLLFADSFPAFWISRESIQAGPLQQAWHLKVLSNPLPCCKRTQLDSSLPPTSNSFHNTCMLWQRVFEKMGIHDFTSSRSALYPMACVSL